MEILLSSPGLSFLSSLLGSLRMSIIKARVEEKKKKKRAYQFSYFTNLLPFI